MICRVHPLNSLNNYRYVVDLTFMGDKLLLSRHRKRATWETQGGHIEAGETPLEAARRELWEESGAQEYDIVPLCDYYAEDETSWSNGQVFVVRLKSLGALPQSEMAETRLFDALPENLTYPAITPLLFAEAKRQGY